MFPFKTHPTKDNGCFGKVPNEKWDSPNTPDIRYIARIKLGTKVELFKGLLCLLCLLVGEGVFNSELFLLLDCCGAFDIFQHKQQCPVHKLSKFPSDCFGCRTFKWVYK